MGAWAIVCQYIAISLFFNFPAETQELNLRESAIPWASLRTLFCEVFKKEMPSLADNWVVFK